MSKSAGELETEQRSTLIALEEIRTELSQLPEHELLHQNVVPLTALVTVRGVYRELKGLRAEMLRLPDFEIANLDRLELYARAFVGAQARYDALRESNREPEALKAEAEALRAQLYDDVKTLVRRKIVAPQRIEKLSRRRGYEHVASDLLLLVTVFRCHLNSIAGKCATTEQELVRAEALAHGITAVVSRRREPLEAVRDALEVRKRAFTVFMRAYASLAVLLEDLAKPPIEKVGALNIDAFLPKSERKALAAALNTLLASPTFASWREGATLDIKAWMTPKNGRTPAVILSVAHLDDEERALVLGVVLEEVLAWVRSLPGSSRLRALLVFDEVYGFLPPHPANPPTKRPIVALMKQARAFGVGVLVATQNPMDVDYRALGNAGVWCIGRLQTDADCARVLDGLSSMDIKGFSTATLGKVIKNLAPRWFVMRDVHARVGTILLQPRWAMSYLRGPMTRNEIRRAREMFEDDGAQDGTAHDDDQKSDIVQHRDIA